MSRRPSELARLAVPLREAADTIFTRLPWWLVALVVVYLGSGLTVVAPDEVGVVLRFGRLSGGAAAVREPGLVLALPAPIDEVVRVPVGRVRDLEITTLDDPRRRDPATRWIVAQRASLTPTESGYALTGDGHVLHVTATVRWQITDPIAYALRHADIEALLDGAVSAALARSIGERSVDAVLSDGREELVGVATRRAQARLDRVGAGVSLVGVELADLAPPPRVRKAFEAVQTARIEADTRVNEADQYAEKTVPAARAQARKLLRDADADAVGRVGQARAAADAFTALAEERRTSGSVLIDRVYREGLEQALSEAGRVRWVPPPLGGRYTDLRVTIGGGAEGTR